MNGGFNMLAYSIIMFLTATLFTGLSIAIYRGKTELIHSYHQTKVTDKIGYGKAFGKALLVLSIAPLLSGLIGLLGDSDMVAMSAVAVLIAGLGIGIVCIGVVQKKYNNGIF